MIENRTIRQSYNGIEVDSDEEIMVLMLFEELQQNGIVDKIERAETFTLSNKFVHHYVEVKQLKTKTTTKNKEQKILEEHVYTPEFKIVWNKESPWLDKFLNISVPIIASKITVPFIQTRRDFEILSYLEAKPGYDKHNMTRLFKINQKWMWDKHKIFVNLIQPHEWFAKYFTPEKYLRTTTGRERKINWQVKSLEEFLNQSNNDTNTQNITTGDTGLLQSLGNESEPTETID